MVQGPGGNASWKEGDTLWVKASGTWMAEALQRDIFVPVDLAALQGAIARADFDVVPRLLGGRGAKPSIETVLHAVMPHPVVVHLHAVEPLAHLVRERAADSLASHLRGFDGWALVPYRRPGAPLARAVQTASIDHPGVRVVFLRSHGLLVGGVTVQEVANTIDEVVARLHTPVDSPLTGTARAAAPAVLPPGYAWCGEPDLDMLACNPTHWRRLKEAWALMPDHVVFLGSAAARIASPATDAPFGHPPPPFLFVKGAGVAAHYDTTHTQRLQLRCYLALLERQPPHEALAVLEADEVAALLTWEAEKLRQALDVERQCPPGRDSA
jgi:rhamnose utilization protein RhaD (predicted bifunctional aldolase and dehydrogenase)